MDVRDREVSYLTIARAPQVSRRSTRTGPPRRRPLPSAGGAPAAALQAPSFTATAKINLDTLDLPKIPKSFLGLSHEWPYVEEMSTQPKYMDMLNYLSSFGGGPINIRIGGGSTDKQEFVPAPKVRLFVAVTRARARVHLSAFVHVLYACA